MRFIIEWGPYQDDEGPNYREQQIEILIWEWGFTIRRNDWSKCHSWEWFHSRCPLYSIKKLIGR